MKDYIEIWGNHISLSLLSEDEIKYLKKFENSQPPDVEIIWDEMNRIWHSFGLNNTISLKDQSIDDFYSHPIWLLNGLYSASDVNSKNHREKISEFIASCESNKIADYGGGFGSLAVNIAKKNPTVKIQVIEPFPSKLGLQRLAEYSNISIVPKLGEGYDLVVCQDVLEHVINPIQLAILLINSVKEGGYLIFANCFHGMIECHLPKTFYLRHTFAWILKSGGMTYAGRMDEVPHIQIFKKDKKLNINSINLANHISRLIGPMLNVQDRFYSLIRKPI
jgi:2-polyprenyl-3-methyl-5-hydroxy-6-metoxy-1,4-benzoquinol methylase